MSSQRYLLAIVLAMLVIVPARAEQPDTRAKAEAVSLVEYFPPPEDQGGWRTLLPSDGVPDDAQKAKIREVCGVDWDKLASAWEFNAGSTGKTGLLVIRRGQIVGEWYQGCDHTTAFNIFSSSKAYTSAAYGLILADFGAGKLPSGETLTLDTKVCNEHWLPETLPLPDPRKAEITVRNLLNMASGLGDEAVPSSSPFEWSFGHVEGSPMAKLKDDPGKVFHYSNAGVSHLVLLFQHATGRDVFPFLKERVFHPVGLKQVRWEQVGGEGHVGPLSQGYSGVNTPAREHARFCYLALHRGEWAGKRIVPASYYEFALTPSPAKADYGAQWWLYPRHPDAPRDLVETAGALNNHGYVVPSLDLVFVRVGDGPKYAVEFDQDLVKRVMAAVEH